MWGNRKSAKRRKQYACYWIWGENEERAEGACLKFEIGEKCCDSG